MTDIIGKIIAKRYRVDSLLGRGGMGDVYKVWDSQRAVFLAMKVLHADLAEDRVFLRRFAREAETLSTLQHPHIVRFYGLEQDGRLTFMLMDYVEGTTLRGQIFDAQQPFTSERIMQVVRPVCSALHYAHQMGRVHCDIKPANIMVKGSGEVLVADFGIARMLENSTTMTMVGAGTPAYMAPEQVVGKNPTRETDIYALGIVLYEMLTGGERPFTGEQAKVDGSTSEKVRWEQTKLKPPSPREHNPALSRELESVVLKCLEKDPAKRYISALELLNALEKAMPASAEIKEMRIEPAPAAPPTAHEFVVQEKKPVTPNQPPQIAWRVGGMAAIGLFCVIFLAWGVMKYAVPMTIPSTTSEPDIGSTQISPKDGMVMVYVPEGEFRMGSGYGDDDEDPEHTIHLYAYWIDETEVTNEMYAKCVADNGACTTHFGNTSHSNNPVVYVDWDMAKAYCEWAGKRLPTEAEWEKAARGTDGRTYPWGEGIGCDRANYNSDCVGDTTDVGRYESGKSPYGAYDMAGNVWEWVNDWYDEAYYQGSPSLNPSGPNSGEYRVLRGGSWGNSEYGTRSANRSRDNPTVTNYYFGFRCARGTSP